MSGWDLKSYLIERKTLVDAALDVRMPSADAEPTAVHAAMRYAVLGAGKRLRPIFSMAVAELAGAAPESVLDAACAVELTHSASLILDDLPCMDNAAQRRGMPCVHTQYGEATALLAAMALLSTAFDWVARNARSLGASECAVEAVPLLSRAIGAEGLVYGQHLDLIHTGALMSLEQLETVHHLKAGALFLAALRLPAQLLGMESDAVTALERFGGNVGLAFQITDDLLDEREPGEDAGKSTFTTHLGRDGAQRKVDTLIEEAVNALERFGALGEPLRQLAVYVRARTH
jgi:geranylgeranyl pyrophosphate synthase